MSALGSGRNRRRGVAWIAAANAAWKAGRQERFPARELAA